MKHLIKVDKDKCIGCKMCDKDCPMLNIKIDNKKADIKSQDCIKCGHCTAVCPKGAISISGYSEAPVEIKEQPKVDSEKLYNAIKFRRTIRHFKKEDIDREIIDKILEVGRYTPTAKNDQDVSYIILDNKLKEAESIAVKFFKKIQPFVGIFYKPAKTMEIDEDFFFKKAPIAIVVVSKNKINGSLAASNMTLMAESYGLGVLYSGFFSVAANKSRALRKLLEIKKSEVVTTLVLGYPNVRYYRNAQKEDAKVKYM